MPYLALRDFKSGMNRTRERVAGAVSGLVKQASRIWRIGNGLTSSPLWGA